MATRKKKDQKPEPSKVEIYSGRKQILCPMQPCVVRPDLTPDLELGSSSSSSPCDGEGEDGDDMADGDEASSPPITSDARDPAPSSARLSPSPQERECELAIEEGENGETEDGETA